MAAKKANSKAKSKRGGSRAGAGRKPSQAKALRQVIETIEIEDAEVITRAEPAIKRRLLRCIENLSKLADGGYSRDRITREPSGLVTAKVVLRNPDGTPMLDAYGKPVVAEQLLYPNKPPGELVVVSHASEIAEPDRAANQYLIDRILGKPHTAEPSKLSETQSVLPSILEAALERAYGGDDNDAEPETQLAIEV